MHATTRHQRRGAGALRLLRIARRWILLWILGGIGLGLLGMFGRMEFMAESGSHNQPLLSYAFWIPFLGVIASVLGIVTGTVFAIAVVMLERIWPDDLQATIRVLVAGSVVGLGLGQLLSVATESDVLPTTAFALALTLPTAVWMRNRLE